MLPLEGGFAGLFQLDFDSPLFSRRYEDPVLVSCTDGVGTKLKVAVSVGRHDTVGIDLVAMSINDALCCGAEPLFFLDYVAMGKDDPDLLEQIVSGISAGCSWPPGPFAVAAAAVSWRELPLPAEPEKMMTWRTKTMMRNGILAGCSWPPRPSAVVAAAVS